MNKYLPIALRVTGSIFILGVYPLTVLWPSGWSWHMGDSNYLQMIIAIYFTLGVFLILAAKNPMQHLALISFALWSSLVHGAVMAVQSIVNAGQHIGHLYGDVPALFAVAATLGWLYPAALAIRLTKKTT